MPPDTTPSLTHTAPARPPMAPWRATAWLFLPLVVLAAILAVLIVGKPLERLTIGAPPVEKVSIERVRLSPGLITLDVRADGSQPESTSPSNPAAFDAAAKAAAAALP